MKPKMLDGSHYVHKLIQIHWFRDVAVSVEVVCLSQVLFSIGCSKHHHRYAAQIGIGFDLLEHLTPVLAGEIQIEQNEIRARRVGVPAPPCQEFTGLNSV